MKTFDKMINNDKEQVSLFHDIINDQINRARNQQSLQFEIGVLEDLKRMAELGCFTVFTTQPNLFEVKLSENDTKINVNCQVPGMMWTGEETISKLTAENNILKAEILELKSQPEKQKSKLLDEFIADIRGKLKPDVSINGVHLITPTVKLINEYDQINHKPTNTDPYIDEVFSGRLYNWLMDYTAGNGIVPRLSECPHINELKNQRGIGMKSLMDYREVMRKYGIEWKN